MGVVWQALTKEVDVGVETEKKCDLVARMSDP